MNWKYEIGDIYKINGQHYVLASSRRIVKGKNVGRVEIELAPFDKKSKEIGMRARVIPGQQLPGINQPDPEFVKANQERAATAADAYYEALADNAEAKQERAESGANIIDELGITFGTFVIVEWSNVPGGRTHEVVDINYASGKIAVAKSSNQSGKRWISARLVSSSRSRTKSEDIEMRWNEMSVAARRGALEVVLQKKSGAGHYTKLSWGEVPSHIQEALKRRMCTMAARVSTAEASPSKDPTPAAEESKDETLKPDSESESSEVPKLTPAQQEAISLINYCKGPVSVSVQTDRIKGTIHGPTAARLLGAGLININPSDKVVTLTALGRKAAK